MEDKQKLEYLEKEKERMKNMLKINVNNSEILERDIKTVEELILELKGRN